MKKIQGDYISVLSNFINENITLWKKADSPAPTRNLFGEAPAGSSLFQSPQTIEVRWEDKIMLLNDEKGQAYQADSVLYTFEEGIQAKDWVYQGTSTATNPEDQDGAREVKQVMITPNIDGTQKLVKVML